MTRIITSFAILFVMMGVLNISIFIRGKLMGAVKPGNKDLVIIANVFFY